MFDILGKSCLFLRLRIFSSLFEIALFDSESSSSSLSILLGVRSILGDAVIFAVKVTVVKSLLIFLPSLLPMMIVSVGVGGISVGRMSTLDDIIEGVVVTMLDML